MSDALMAGFPPPPESVVSLGNWQDPPFNRWSFQHLREIVPTQRIARGARAKAAGAPDNPPALDHIAVTRLGAGPSTVGEVLADTWTDAVIVLHDGQIVLERYFGQMRANTPHLLMSVSKSIVGCVCGILASQRRLDPEAPITQYVPEIAGSGYDGATVRHLLDMRTGVAFSEAYEDPDAEVRVIERHMGWRPGGERRERRPVRLSRLAVLAGASRRPVRLPLGRHRRSRLGVRARRRRTDGRPGVHPHLGADGRRVRRRDHL